MVEVLVIFCVAVAGSVARLLAGLTLKLAASKLQNETLADGLAGSCYLPPVDADPILRCGLTLACDGAIVLALVSALPGALALERTGLAFAILCVGGLFGEMAGIRVTQASHTDTGAADAASRRQTSRLLAVALTLALNLGFAVLSAGQGLIEIIPPETMQGNGVKELDPLVVIAQRPYDPLEGDVPPRHHESNRTGGR